MEEATGAWAPALSGEPEHRFRGEATPGLASRSGGPRGPGSSSLRFDLERAPAFSVPHLKTGGSEMILGRDSGRFFFL